MAQQDPQQKNIPWLIPGLTVRDVAESLAFYEKAFGFKPGASFTDDIGDLAYADMEYQNQMIIMVMREGTFGGTAMTPANSSTESAVSLYVYCDDVDALFTQAKEAGAQVVSPPEDMFWHDRVTRLKDPDGHSWSFATKIEGKEPA